MCFFTDVAVVLLHQTRYIFVETIGDKFIEVLMQDIFEGKVLPSSFSPLSFELVGNDIFSWVGRHRTPHAAFKILLKYMYLRQAKIQNYLS